MLFACWVCRAIAETTNEHPCNVIEDSLFITEDQISRVISGYNATDKTPMYEMRFQQMPGIDGRKMVKTLMKVIECDVVTSVDHA